jgi:low affinity Fe/Cu permease
VREIKEQFQQVSIRVAKMAGSIWAFVIAVIIVLVWLVLGPVYHYSNTWLIAIATISDIVIFLMVFSIQNTQNRDSRAIQLKLNELIIADKKARDAFVGLEALTDDELNEIDGEFQKLLESLATTPAMKKLHKKISQEKKIRLGISEKEDSILDTLLSPFSGEEEEKKLDS